MTIRPVRQAMDQEPQIYISVDGSQCIKREVLSDCNPKLAEEAIRDAEFFAYFSKITINRRATRKFGV
jgi:hypothetical protein